MIKKSTKTVVKVEVPKKEEITFKDILTLAKEKGYTGSEDLYYIQDWIRNQHGLHGEIFYSLFHKKWSINNYFINIVKGDRVNWNYTFTNYSSYTEALIVLIYNLLLCL